MGELADPLRYDTSSQPLTRADCGKAGMLWNEGANVCTDSTSTLEANLNLFQTKAPEVRVFPLAAMRSPSWANQNPSLLRAANRRPLCTSPRLRQWRVPARWRRPRHRSPKPKTAKSSTPSRAKVPAAKASSKSKLVKSGGSRGRVVAAKLSTKSSVKTASKSSVKNAAKTVKHSCQTVR